MKITKVNIPKSEKSIGLEDVKMDKLGQVVLLAGKNGAGKTRLFNLIENIIQLKPKRNQIENIGLELSNIETRSSIIKRNIKNDEMKLKLKNNNEIEVIKKRISENEETFKSYEQKIQELKKLNKWDLIETNELYDNYKIIHFVPKKLELLDCTHLTKEQIRQSSENLNIFGSEYLANGTFPRIQLIQDRWFNSTHQNSTISQNKKDINIVDYEKLKNLIKLFLNTNLDRNDDGEVTLFGFSLGKSKLSDGQKILLQLCLAIHCQGESLDELVLFLDEPENHLHPSVIIEIIEKIIENTKNGQVWIATHSIPLLSHFDPSSIWYVENNKISYAGNEPEKVLNSLLGDENQIGKLQDFISLPSIFALNRYAFESLFHPEAVLTNSKDPQTLQIKEQIKKYLKNKDKIRLLDYGVGKGRLLSNIIEANKEPLNDFTKWFDYIAYDKFDFDKSDCLSVIEKIYSEPEKRYFNDFSDLFAIHDKESFDIVIMCNVFHEIDPNDWLSLFKKDGDIPKLLKNTGILLLVEDQEMPIGEKAYQKGFIVLDTAELKELFNIKETDNFEFSDARNDGRLKSHIIQKNCLTRISAKTRLKAIESLNKKSKERILSIRQGEVSYKNGKKHGFWVQQFANTGLAISELK